MKYFNNKKYLIILGLSFLSLIPFSFFVYNMVQLAIVANIKIIDDDFIKRTMLAQNIHHFKILFPFICGLFVWISTAVLSAYWLHKKQINIVFSYASLLIGGLGIHLFIMLFLEWKHNFKIKISHKWSTVISLGGINSMIVAAIVPYIVTESDNRPDTPVVGDPIQLSLDENNPNLIEVFSDGFDRAVHLPYMLKEENFKDFNFFNRFMTAGTATHRSLTVLWGGKEYNTFNLYKEHNLSPTNAQDQIYSKYFLEAGLKHMTASQQNFDQRTLVNPINWSTNSGYQQTTSGMAWYVKQKYPELNVTNWSGARDALYGKWGASNVSADKVSYEWTEKNLQVATGTKGARVLNEDLITHRSFQLDANGRFSLHTHDIEIQFQNLRNILSELISKLKATKGIINGKEVSAYDNSMIVFYGDHGSHEMDTHEPTKLGDNLRRAESLLMIKYPHQTYNNMNVINDRYVYGSELNGIIDHYFANKQEAPLNYFNNAKFNNVPRPIFSQENQYNLAQWIDDTSLPQGLGQKIVPIGKNVVWDEANKKQLASEVMSYMED